jgi:hypothetical protein
MRFVRRVRESNRAGSLRVIVALCAGVAVGSVCTLLVVPKSAPASSSNDQSDTRIAALANQIEELRASVHGMQARSDSAVVRPAATAIVDDDFKRTRNAVEPQPAAHDRESNGAKDWLSVLDHDVGRALIEHGLTPYDPGVSTLVRNAGESLRDADDDWLRKRAQVLSSRNTMSSEDLPLLAPIDSERQERRRAILSELSTGLDALTR